MLRAPFGGCCCCWRVATICCICADWWLTTCLRFFTLIHAERIPLWRCAAVVMPFVAFIGKLSHAEKYPSPSIMTMVSWKAKLKSNIPNQAYNVMALPGYLHQQMWREEIRHSLWIAIWWTAFHTVKNTACSSSYFHHFWLGLSVVGWILGSHWTVEVRLPFCAFCHWILHCWKNSLGLSICHWHEILHVPVTHTYAALSLYSSLGLSTRALGIQWNAAPLLGNLWWIAV